nr:tetratricopeptide repeat protein [Streptomyces sp. NBC_01001]
MGRGVRGPVRADLHCPLDAEGLERLALAAHMTGRDRESADAWTRAHHAWLSAGEIPRAVRCAFRLGLDLVLSGEQARATGWMARGQRLLDTAGAPCVEEGYLLALEGLRSYSAGDFVLSRAVSEQALTIATRYADADLQNFSMVSIGECLIELREERAGIRLLDEAMVAVTAGEVSPIVSGLAYCAVITACHEVFDLRRAREWTAEMSRWCANLHDQMPYRGVCLVHRVEVMRLHGDWADAMEEADRACRCLASVSHPVSADAAYYQLGELYRLRGEHDQAERAYRDACRFGHSGRPGLALSLPAAGEAGAAERAIRTRSWSAPAAPDRPGRDPRRGGRSVGCRGTPGLHGGGPGHRGRHRDGHQGSRCGRERRHGVRPRRHRRGRDPLARREGRRRGRVRREAEAAVQPWRWCRRSRCGHGQRPGWNGSWARRCRTASAGRTDPVGRSSVTPGT